MMLDTAILEAGAKGIVRHQAVYFPLNTMDRVRTLPKLGDGINQGRAIRTHLILDLGPGTERLGMRVVHSMTIVFFTQIIVGNVWTKRTSRLMNSMNQWIDDGLHT